jgi:multiple sugar transport system permease protein
MKKTIFSSRLISRGFVYAAAIMIALWILIPIYLITIAAFSPREIIYEWPKTLFPRVLSTETMRFFLGAHNVLDSFKNSLIVAGISLVLSLVIGAPAGYGLARYIFRGKDFFRIAILSTRAFPIVILSIPLAVTFINWGLYDSLISVALLHVAMALPTTILVTSSVFMGISKELEEAAMTMGCNPMQAFLRIVLPLSLPGLVASAIFTFVLSWNEVFAATILTIFNRTLPALLIVQLDASSIAYRFAGGFFILIPAVVFMFFVRRYMFSLWGITLK